jgi:THO complex subunit 3
MFELIYGLIASRATHKIKTGSMSNINFSWSPDGNYIAVGNRSDIITIYDAHNQTHITKLKINAEVNTLIIISLKVLNFNLFMQENEFAWSANSDHILVARGLNGVGGVDLLSFTHNSKNSNSDSATKATPELTLLDTINAHSAASTVLRIDPTYCHMAVGSMDHTVSLWDLEDLVCHHSFALE